MVKLGRSEEIAPGSLAGVEVNGKPVVVCNVNGEFFALDGTCPHVGGPLAEGNLNGHTIVCPWHCGEFDCRTGEGDYGQLAVYSVKIEDGDILIDAGAA